jgi:hypothetical protein
LSARPRYTFVGARVGSELAARDDHLERDVLIKPWWSAADRAALQLIAAVLAGLQNKHIADVYDLLEVPGSGMAVVEERLTGSDLGTWSSTPRSEGEVLRVLLQMTSAVTALHASGLTAPSLAFDHWRFDGDGLLNLSAFVAPQQGGRALLPESLTPDRQAADVRSLAQHAKHLATRHLTGGPALAPVLADPVLRGLWQGEPGTSTLEAYRERLHACCVRDQHRAMVVSRQRALELSAKNRTITLTHPVAGIARGTISYDGIAFVITATGELYLNNLPIPIPTLMPSSCILTLGAPTRTWAERHFITFDASQPEVVF